MSYKVKFNYNGTFRRTSVDSLTHETVEKAARAVFVIPLTHKITLTWVDEEGDTVHVSSEEEFREFLSAQTFPGMGRVLGHASPALYKFGVVTEEKQCRRLKEAEAAPVTTEGKTVHRHVTCDGCGVSPLVGIRYKCTGRVDYDLCEECEEKTEQPFPMLKMYEPRVGIRLAVKGQGFGPQINKRRGRDASIPPPPPFEGPVVHEGVTCDQCGVGPVVGIRFKCTGREDFDLCSACEASKPQPFPMIKIYRPDISVHVKGWGTEGRRCPANPHGFTNFPFFHGKGGRGGCGGKWRHCPSKQGGESGSEAAEMWPRKGEAVEAIASVVSNVAEVAKSFMEDVDEQILKQTMQMSMEEGEKGQSKSDPSPASSTSSAASFSGVNLRTLKPMARFVGDITIPDATVVAPSTDFVKIWLVRNDGPCDWPTFGDGVRLVTAGGDPLCDAALSIPVESIRVGEETHISVTLKSPPTPGRYVSYFRLQAADGIVFGQKLWVDIRVQATSGHVGFTSPAFAVAKPAAQKEDGAESKSSAEAPTQAPLAVTLATTLSSSETGSETPVEMEFPGGDFEEVLDPVAPVEDATALSAGPVNEDALWEAEREQMEQDWKVELDALRGMGFHNTRENVKLLKKHTKTSFSRFPQLQGKPFSDSLSTILDALLH